MYTLEEVESKCVVQLESPKGHAITSGNGVTLTHIPTGIVAECEDCNSTHKNKAYALDLLVDKLNSLTEPLPCPFCGCSDIDLMNDVEFDEFFYCACSKCLAESGMGDTEKEAIDVWNKRF